MVAKKGRVETTDMLFGSGETTVMMWGSAEAMDVIAYSLFLWQILANLKEKIMT